MSKGPEDSKEPDDQLAQAVESSPKVQEVEEASSDVRSDAEEVLNGRNFNLLPNGYPAIV